MPKPLVSIVISTYNTAQYLPTAIRSCLAQTYQETEIIVVDDGSPDDTLSALKDFTEVHYIRKTNGGVASARNRGLLEAKGEFIQILDADDYLLPTKIERCMQTFETQPSAHVVYTDFEQRTADLSSRYIGQKQYILDRPQGQILLSLLRNLNAYFPPNAALVRRNILEQVGGFNERLKGTDDWYLWINLAAHDAEFRYIPEVLAWSRMTPGSLSKQKLVFSEARLFAWEDLQLLPIPQTYFQQIDLNAKLADRHHVLALVYWEDRRLVEAREHFRAAIKLQLNGRSGRRLLLMCTYALSRRHAAQMISRLVRLRSSLFDMNQS